MTLDLKAIESDLLDLRMTLLQRVERTNKHLHGRDAPVSSVPDEQSVEMDNQLLVMQLDEEGRDELRQIEQALARLRAGQYETCKTCGKEIAEARLEAVPFATNCITCENNRSK